MQTYASVKFYGRTFNNETGQHLEVTSLKFTSFFKDLYGVYIGHFCFKSFRWFPVYREVNQKDTFRIHYNPTNLPIS